MLGFSFFKKVFFILYWSSGEPGRLQYMGSQRVGHDVATEHACIAD